MSREAPDGAVPDRGLTRWAASPLTWTLVSALLIALRAPEAWTTPQLWAEDGTTFLVDALTRPFASLFEHYAGYLCLLPRLLALSAWTVRLAWVPAVYVILAFAVTIAIMLYVAKAPMPVRHWQVAPLALAIVPHNGEVMFNLTNIQWIAACGLAIAAASPPSLSRGRRLADFLVVFVAGLSGPFSILFLPGFALRLLASWRNSHTRALSAMALATSCVQLWHITRLLPNESVWPGWDPLLHFVFGAAFSEWLTLGMGQSWGMVAFLGLALVLSAPLSRAETRIVTAILCFCAAVLLAATAAKFSKDLPNLMVLSPLRNGARYFYTPAVFLAWILWIALWSQRRASRVAAGAGLTLLATSGFLHFSAAPRPDFGWIEQVRRFKAGEIDAIRIPPPGWPPLRPPRR